MRDSLDLLMDGEGVTCPMCFRPSCRGDCGAGDPASYTPLPAPRLPWLNDPPEPRPVSPVESARVKARDEEPPHA